MTLNGTNFVIPSFTTIPHITSFSIFLESIDFKDTFEIWTMPALPIKWLRQLTFKLVKSPAIWIISIMVGVFFWHHHYHHLHHRFWTQFDHQAFGELRRYFVAAPRTNFRHKYDTPYYSRFNLNTKTNLMAPCGWLEGNFWKLKRKTAKEKSQMKWGTCRQIRHGHMYHLLIYGKNDNWLK